MSRRFTYLLAGLTALSAVPGVVAAQSVKLNTSQQTIYKLGTGWDFTNERIPSKATFKTASQKKVPRRATTETFNVPYFEDFDSQEAFDNFTVIDNNNDNSTWQWGGDYYQWARYRWSSENPADDWLITPGINLKAGKSYLVSYKASANNANYPERLEARWGQGSTIDALTEELTPSTDITSASWKVFSKEITPTADGAYNFGFHAISNKYEFYLNLDSISITELSDAGAPDSVTNLTATADPTAALKVTLAFNAPSKTMDGSALASVDSIVIRKDGATIKDFTSVSPGEALSFVDENATRGLNKYTVLAANGNGEGRPVTVYVIAGPDIPNPPVVTAHDNQTSIKFTWPDVTGVNGGVIVPSDVSYEIWNTRVDGNGLSLADSITTVKGVNEYTIDENTTQGDQDIKYWAFNAKNKNGASGYNSASVIIGAPYTLPFSNSFANATLEDQFFGVKRSSSHLGWSLTAKESAENDSGSALFSNYVTYDDYKYGYSGEASLYTGKISLTNANNPELVFSYNGSTSTNARLVTEVEHSNGDVDSLWSENFTSGADTWKTATVNLPESVADEPYVFIHFKAVANDNQPQEIYVDNIHVADPYQNDAAVAITAPASLNKGMDADLIATVSNQGINPLSGFEVKIYANDEVIKDTTVSSTLAIFDNVAIPVTYKTSSLQNETSLNVKAEVISTNDLNESNNIAVADIVLTQADLNAPTNLKGTETADSVVISWSAPETVSESVTDDFESYTGWITDNVGDWTFVNADGSQFGSLTGQNEAEPNAEAYAAYEVWHPSGVFSSGQGLGPHSGEQCLASVYKVDYNAGAYIDADDWVISPELSGAQTISFWVNNVAGSGYGTETFQVLASTTDKQTSSFTQVGDNYTQGSGSWTQISADLPEGSKYFAIRRVTSGADQLLFLIDDIAYQKGTNAASYNIYVDGKLIGNTTDTSFGTASDGDNHTYSVTAVYGDGSESAPVSIDLVANSIDDIHANLGTDGYNIYTLDGMQVKRGTKSYSDLKPGVYVINGRKVVVK